MDKITSTFLTRAIITIAVALVTLVTIYTSVARAANQPTIDLGAAESFAILAGTPGITDAGNTSVIDGNVGLSPASGSGIGLLCSQVNGVVYSVNAAGPLPCRVTNGPLLVTAKNNLSAAYTDAAGRTPLTTVPTELGGTTVVAGTYDSVSTTFGITAGAGPLVIDGQNDPSSVFIFEAAFSGTGLTVGPGATISLINGAQACNVFWRVDSADINTGGEFKGTILALNSITVANGANIEGRLLARNGSVSLINDTITVPTCADTDSDSDTGAGSGGGSGAGTDEIAPGFPNTGSLIEASRLWVIAPASLVIITLLSAAYIVRKRHLV